MHYKNGTTTKNNYPFLHCFICVIAIFHLPIAMIQYVRILEKILYSCSYDKYFYFGQINLGNIQDRKDSKK